MSIINEKSTLAQKARHQKHILSYQSNKEFTYNFRPSTLMNKETEFSSAVGANKNAYLQAQM